MSATQPRVSGSGQVAKVLAEKQPNTLTNP